MNDTDELRAAAQQALECLEQLQGGCTDSDDGTVEAITVWCPEIIDALRAALAQPAAAPDRWNEGFKHGQWLAKHSAPVVECADSATPFVERSAGNVSDNAATVAPAEPASKPVARLLVWHGPKHLPVPPPAARTYAEFSEDSAGPQKQGAYWHNGTPLYAAPQPAPARVPLTEAEIASMQRKANTTGVQFLQSSTVRWIVRAIEAHYGITAQGEPK